MNNMNLSNVLRSFTSGIESFKQIITGKPGGKESSEAMKKNEGNGARAANLQDEISLLKANVQGQKDSIVSITNNPKFDKPGLTNRRDEVIKRNKAYIKGAEKKIEKLEVQFKKIPNAEGLAKSFKTTLAAKHEDSKIYKQPEVMDEMLHQDPKTTELLDKLNSGDMRSRINEKFENNSRGIFTPTLTHITKADYDSALEKISNGRETKQTQEIISNCIKAVENPRSY